MTSQRVKTGAWSLAVLLVLCGAGAGAREGPLGSARAMSARALTANIVIPQSRAVQMEHRPQAVQITGVAAAVEIVEQAAATTLEISVHNPTGARMEAEMLVPVPEGAAVRSFTFQGAGAEPTAALLPKEDARRIYNQIVSQTRDPALLEFIGYNLIRSSVFPVEPNADQKIRLTYENLLLADGERIDYILPRSESLEYEVPWQISVTIKSKRPLSTVYSPSHRLEVLRKNAHLVVARTADEASREPGAFRLAYLPEGEGVTASLLAYPDPKLGGGYFLLLAGLPAKPAPEPGAAPLRREVTLVLDRSGSMNGEKIKQVREAALQLVEGLEPGEAFNIIPYNEAVDSFAERPVVKSAETVKQARAYIESIQARGGTNIYEALLEALRQKPMDGYLPIVLFLTDGLPTVGQTNEVAIRELAEKANPHKRRIFTFGVGVDVNTPLLARVASLTRATATFVAPKEDVEAKVGQVFKRLNGPVLADPELAILDPDGKPALGRTRDLLPSRLPDLYEGDQLILLGQYLGDQALGFQVSGNYLGKKRAFRFTFPLDKATTRNAFVPRLWASRKIGVLVDAIRQVGGERSVNSTVANTDPRVKELIDEVVRLSQEFGILTEYTAFLAREGSDLSDLDGNFERANRRFVNRAQNRRDGWNGVYQEGNIASQRDQQVLNSGNGMLQNADLKGNGDLSRVRISNVQQFSDRTFFNNSGRWVESRVSSRKTKVEPKRVIEFGSEEFMKLAEQLATEGRQNSIALRGEIVLQIGEEIVLVRNPVATAGMPGAQRAGSGRRSESNEAEILMRAAE